MPGLVPGIHVVLVDTEDVDGRIKSGQDVERAARLSSAATSGAIE
jgi:hypothetical protein